jgi:hypothetical protein
MDMRYMRRRVLLFIHKSTHESPSHIESYLNLKSIVDRDNTMSRDRFARHIPKYDDFVFINIHGDGLLVFDTFTKSPECGPRDRFDCPIFARFWPI